MATEYRVKFVNKTDRVWTMGVYQTFPSSPGLDSVAWKRSTAPVGGTTGVNWNVTYNVALADYQQEGGIGVYEASQILETNLGTVWDIVFEEGVQQLKPTGEKAPLGEQIIIRNKSHRRANPGIGMDGDPAVYKHDTLSGSDAQFLVTPTYHVGLFNRVVLGEVISHNVIAGPLKLKFPSGDNLAVLTASLDGQNLKLDLQYGSTMGRLAASLIVPQSSDIEAAA